MRTRTKWAIAAVSILALLTVFTAFVLPMIVKSQAMARVKEGTGRTLALSRVGLNPFTWTVSIEGVRLSEKGSEATFASFSSVRASVSPMSIFRRGAVVREVAVVKPYVRIVRTGANTYNFSDLIPKPDPAAKKSEQARFSLNNITIRGGSVDFIDRAIPRECSHTIRNLDLAVPFVSNIPYLADRYVVPKLHADINNAPLRLDGKLKPYAKAAEYSVNINLQDLDIPFYASYVPATLPVVFPSGKLSVNAEVTHRAVSEGKPDVIAKGIVALRQLALDERAGGSLVKIAGMEAKIASVGILTGNYDFSSLTLDKPEIFVRRSADGTVNIASLSGKKNVAEKTEELVDEQKRSKPQVSLGAFRIASGAVHYTDRVPTGGFTTDIGNIDVSVDGFGTAAGRTARYTFAALSNRQEKFAAAGNLSVEPLNVTCDLKLADLVIEAYQPYLAAFLTKTLKGRVDVATSANYVPDGGNLNDIEVRLRDVNVPFAGSDGVKLSLAALKGGTFDLKTQQMEIAEISLNKGAIRISRDEKGRLSPLALLREQPAAAPEKPQKAGEKKSSSFACRIKTVSGSGLDVGFTDGMKEDSPQFDLRKISFNVGNVTLPKQGAMPFKVAAGYGKTGSLSAAGTLTPAPFKVKADCTVKRLPIPDFEPYFPENLAMSFADGLLDAALRVELAQAKEAMTGSFRGNVGVRSMYALDADSEDLLRWESLELENMAGTLSPFSLSIADVALNKFFAKVIFNRDGTLNLKQLYTSEPKPDPAAPVTAAVTAPVVLPVTAVAAAPAAAAKGKSVKIETVTLQDGVVVFSDRQTRPEYTTKLVNLGGRVSGLSSEEAKFADVDLRGNLENQSPLRITGKINPLREDLFVDLKVSMTDIELSPMTPYSGTYLGYSLDRGKLFLDLKYFIQNKKLDATNKVFIDQLTFGKSIESDKATRLPVKLAVALLKDRKGEIHLDLPLSGRTDDPEFSVFSVVLQMLKNLLVKAATAPFALLTSAFGGKDDFSAVAFVPGTSDLAAGEADKLARLAQALRDRPSLKLEVMPFVDRERDAEGYRHELLAKKMKNEKFLALAKEKKLEQGQAADAVQVLPEEKSRYLKAVYLKEKFPKPRNVIGLVKDLPDEEMRKLFLANVVVGEQDLQNLARERAAVVKGYLVGLGKLEAERVFEKSGDIHKKPEKAGEVCRVEFGVAAQ